MTATMTRKTTKRTNKKTEKSTARQSAPPAAASSADRVRAAIAEAERIKQMANDQLADLNKQLEQVQRDEAEAAQQRWEESARDAVIQAAFDTPGRVLILFALDKLTAMESDEWLLDHPGMKETVRPTMKGMVAVEKAIKDADLAFGSTGEATMKIVRALAGLWKLKLPPEPKPQMDLPFPGVDDLEDLRVGWGDTPLSEVLREAGVSFHGLGTIRDGKKEVRTLHDLAELLKNVDRDTPGVPITLPGLGPKLSDKFMAAARAWFAKRPDCIGAPACLHAQPRAKASPAKNGTPRKMDPAEFVKKFPPSPGANGSPKRAAKPQAKKTPSGGAKLTKAEVLSGALRRALHSTSGAERRWADRIKTGLTDPVLLLMIGEEFGIEGGQSGDEFSFSVKGGKNPRFWLGKLRPAKDKPTLQGPALIAAVRELLNIPNPMDKPAPAKPADNHTKLDELLLPQGGYELTPREREFAAAVFELCTTPGRPPKKKDHPDHIFKDIDVLRRQTIYDTLESAADDAGIDWHPMYDQDTPRPTKPAANRSEGSNSAAPAQPRAARLAPKPDGTPYTLAEAGLKAEQLKNVCRPGIPLAQGRGKKQLPGTVPVVNVQGCPFYCDGEGWGGKRDGHWVYLRPLYTPEEWGDRPSNVDVAKLAGRDANHGHGDGVICQDKRGRRYVVGPNTESITVVISGGYGVDDRTSSPASDPDEETDAQDDAAGSPTETAVVEPPADPAAPAPEPEPEPAPVDEDNVDVVAGESLSLAAARITIEELRNAGGKIYPPSTADAEVLAAHKSTIGNPVRVGRGLYAFAHHLQERLRVVCWLHPLDAMSPGNVWMEWGKTRTSNKSFQGMAPPAMPLCGVICTTADGRRFSFGRDKEAICIEVPSDQWTESEMEPVRA